ncbi:MAG: SUMF1/EgtB/PvdO family nonheme iron enzyme [Myxococcales bacterium]|nr:SUMF1/EgtB/PvdO family nonheme iron enzyme [Myxococcales bacterium]
MKNADLGRISWFSLLAAACSSPLLGCGGSPARAIAGEAPTVGEAFGVRCEAVRAQEAPDLMAWDPASRANLGRLRQRGVVAVRYESRGCDVKLELLPNCRGLARFSLPGGGAAGLGRRAARVPGGGDRRARPGAGAPGGGKSTINYRKAGREGHPINCVSLDDAKRVCQSRGLLVPTEQQWVWAARGNAQRAFPWGEDEDSGRACSDRAKEGTCEVTAHPRGATPEGVVGLVGNVSELVETGVNGTRAMGGDYRKAVKDLRPYSGRSADSAPEIGVRCVTR